MNQPQGDGENNNNAPPHQVPPGPVHPPRPARAIGAYDRPNVNGQRLGIRAPPVAANNFEVKPGLLNVIENNKYHGLPVEDPFDHLDKFDSYCGLSKTNGVSEDAFKLKLFPFSLGDKARQWEKTIPSDTITTWAECKDAFLEKFFSSSRTAKLRNEISSFQQMNMEGFSEAWERFKGYQSQCPHHGFSKESLLSTFYRGALPKYRARLDTASNGFFLGRTEVDAEELVDNMVKSDAVYSEEHDRSNRGGDKQTRKEIKALEDKIDLLIADKATQEQMKAVGNTNQEVPPSVNEVDGLEGQEELCFINNNGSWYRKEPHFQYNQQGGYQNRNQQGSYQSQQTPPGFSNKGNQSSPQQANPSPSAPQGNNTDALLKQILESQTRSEKHVGYELAKLHSKIDGNYTDLNNKFLHLASTAKALENQFSSITSTSHRPGKDHCNVVLSADTPEIKVNEYEREVDEIERLLYGSEPVQNENQLVDKTDGQIVKKVEAKVMDSIKHQAVQKVESKVDQKAEAEIVKQAAQKAERLVDKEVVQKLKGVELEENHEVELSPYDKLPFPKRIITKAQKKVISQFRKALSDVGIHLPQISNMQEACDQMILIKDILAHKEDVAKLLDTSSSFLDPKTPPKSLPKLEDQGKFILPCSLGDFKIADALVDTGACVNVISLEMVESLGIKGMEPNNSSLMFGDSSSTKPIGLIKDFPLKIGTCTIPIDLTVLNMASKERMPLLLGTPFLTTVGACIDFPNKKVVLHNITKKVSYPIKLHKRSTHVLTITLEGGKDPPSH